MYICMYIHIYVNLMRDTTKEMKAYDLPGTFAKAAYG